MNITEMDSLAEQVIKVKAEIAELEEIIEEKKQKISDILERVQAYFIETNRESPYVAPEGTLYLKKGMQIPAPKGPALKQLFEHFAKIWGEEVAWQKLSINTMTLQSEVKQHIAAVEERGGDPILEPLPGVEAPKYFKTLAFRKANKK